MNQDILKDLLPRLKSDFVFKDSGDRFIGGKCPNCNKNELYTFKNSPWALKCGRASCSAHHKPIFVKEEYPEYFENWSERYKKTEAQPHAAADAYLISARGLNINGLSGAYSQEYFKDFEKNIGSATVRFGLPGGAWWERLIDQPNRFEGSKAKFSPKARDGSGGYKGNWWAHPKDTIEILAKSPEIWIAEGIFDALSLRQAGKLAVSAMTVANYCDNSLSKIVKYLADNNINTRPVLVFAYDVGKAGNDYTIKHVERAQSEGWYATAAQPAGDEIAKKQDWNDLLIAGKLTEDNWEHYLWLGELLLADSPQTKAQLLSRKLNGNAFHFTFENKTYWAKLDNKKYDKNYDEGLSEKKAREGAFEVSEIANCKFRFLYFQRDLTTDETFYYLEIINSRGMKIPDRFSGSQISAAADFKKRLLTVGAGAQWTGNTIQLERIVARGTDNIKTVQTLPFTGYDIKTGAYVLGDVAVKNGRVHKINAENYFDIGKSAVKLTSTQRILEINLDNEKPDLEWLENLWIAYRENGLITFVFWVATLFAEQVREKQKSFPFLEMTGGENTGKTTLIEFLWKLCGREGFEGFDPSKATAAGIARVMTQVSNLPVVFMEGDRNSDVAHTKKFDWDELKAAYNGKGLRVRAMKNGGNETYEPPFRASIIAEQNYKIAASPALLSRLLCLEFTNDYWSNETKKAAEYLEQIDVSKISSNIIHIISNEKNWLDRFQLKFSHWERRIRDHSELKVKHPRVQKTHAQLHSWVDACFTGENPLYKLPTERIILLHAFIDKMAITRDLTLNSDHEVVSRFWRKVYWLDQRSKSGDFSRLPLNHHRKSDQYFAINLTDFEKRCTIEGVKPDDPIDIVRKHLKSSKHYKFIECKNVNSVHDFDNPTVHCWVFEQPTSGKEI